MLTFCAVIRSLQSQAAACILVLSCTAHGQESIRALGDSGSLSKSIRIDDTNYDMEIRKSRNEILGGQDDERQQIHLLELFMQKATEQTNLRRRIWWTIWFAPLKGTVVGELVFDMCAIVRSGRPVVLLAMANTYYASTVLFLIDPSREISDAQDQLRPAPEGQNATAARFKLVAESQLERIEIPADLRGNMYGTRNISVNATENSIRLDIQKADGSKLTLQLDIQKKTWIKLPS